MCFGSCGYRVSESSWQKLSSICRADDGDALGRRSPSWRRRRSAFLPLMTAAQASLWRHLTSSSPSDLQDPSVNPSLNGAQDIYCLNVRHRWMGSGRRPYSLIASSHFMPGCGTMIRSLGYVRFCSQGFFTGSMSRHRSSTWVQVLSTMSRLFILDLV